MRTRSSVAAALLALAALCSLSAAAGEDAAARKLIERTDAYLQELFLKDDGAFGVSRIPAIPKHENVRFGGYEGREIDKALHDSGREIVVAFQHVAHPLGDGTQSPTPFTERIDGLWWFTPDGKTMPLRAIHPKPDPIEPLLPLVKRLRPGGTRDNGAWTVARRPVRASKASCVGCHKGAQIGDTLGVLVYGVRRAAATAAR